MSYFANLCNKLRLKLFYVFAGLSSVLVMFLFLLLPMYLFRQYYDIPLSTKGPDGEIWFLIIGGGLGAGSARLVFHLILNKAGGYGDPVIENLWQRRKIK